jgi:hypothetical protein
VPVTDFDPYCLKHGEERRELFKLATLEDAGLKRSALLKYLLPKKPSEKRRCTDFAPVGVKAFRGGPVRFLLRSLAFRRQNIHAKTKISRNGAGSSAYAKWSK